MKTFEVFLTRSYILEIDAKDDRDALFTAEFFVGCEKDLSNERERAERGFRINEIEMTMNDAIECTESNG